MVLQENPNIFNVCCVCDCVCCSLVLLLYVSVYSILEAFAMVVATLSSVHLAESFFRTAGEVEREWRGKRPKYSKGESEKWTEREGETGKEQKNLKEVEWSSKGRTREKDRKSVKSKGRRLIARGVEKRSVGQRQRIRQAITREYGESEKER